jgi:hypothetical protein
MGSDVREGSSSVDINRYCADIKLGPAARPQQAAAADRRNRRRQP